MNNFSKVIAQRALVCNEIQMFDVQTLDKTWDALETLLASRRRTIVDVLTRPGDDGCGRDADEPRGSATDVYKLLSDLYMQTCSVKVSFTFSHIAVSNHGP